jgi:hypothetical protein
MKTVFLYRFLRTSALFSIIATSLNIPINIHTGSHFSTSSPTLAIFCSFESGCSGGYELIVHCGFDFNFPHEG